MFRRHHPFLLLLALAVSGLETRWTRRSMLSSSMATLLAGGCTQQAACAKEEDGPRSAVSQQALEGRAARRNTTDQYGGALLGSKEPVKQSALCASGLYTNVAQGKCTDVGDITKDASSKELDSAQGAAADKLAAKLGL